MDMHTELDRARRRGWADAMAEAARQLRAQAGSWRELCNTMNALEYERVAKELERMAGGIERTAHPGVPAAEPPRVAAGPDLRITTALCGRHGRTLHVSVIDRYVEDSVSPACMACIWEKAAVAGGGR